MCEAKIKTEERIKVIWPNRRWKVWRNEEIDWSQKKM